MKQSNMGIRSGYIELPPSPTSLAESLRDIGYSMPTAIADLIDNSITAQATEISISSRWNNQKPWLAVIDNGHGMGIEDLVAAMRLGSRSPLLEREKKDLGRFGLGMKTASFSQCRQLTVISKIKGQEPRAVEWDLDELANAQDTRWNLNVKDLSASGEDSFAAELVKDYLDAYLSGTIILWRKMDRIAPEEKAATRESYFNAIIQEVRDYISLVFHRFLSAENFAKKIQITMNGANLIGFDPFNSRHPATQELPKQNIVVKNETIGVQPYVLPHHNKVSREEWEKLSGPGGYFQNQGFYVYRENRLISFVTWFRIIKKQELTKLVRVRIDIPNSLDMLWGIDVKKSRAIPPESVRNQLKQIIAKIEFRGKQVYKQRGTVLRSDSTIYFWNRVARDQAIYYEINREHPLLKSFAGDLEGSECSKLNNIISAIESTFPREQYYNDLADTPESVIKERLTDEVLEEILKNYIAIIFNNKTLEEEEIEKILSIEPFASHKDDTQNIIKRGRF